MSAHPSFENPTAVVETGSKVRVAPDLAVLHFDRTDVSLFRNLATLAQKAGVPERDLPKLALKELADNALDAGGRVTFHHDDEARTWVIDDGPGIDGTDEEIAALFSFGRVLRSSKLLRLPTRGAMGNGIRVVVGLVLCSGGALVVRTGGRELTLVPQDNGDTVVRSSAPWTGAGTEIGVSFGADDDLLDWAMVAADHVGLDSYKGASSPYWYDSDSFFELCAASPPGLSVRGLVERLDGCSGRKAGTIAEPFLNRLARAMTRADAEALLSRARDAAKEVTPKRLGLVGEQPRFEGYGKAAGVVQVSGRNEGTYRARVPVVVEAWAIGRPNGRTGVTLLVNRTRAAAAVEAYHYGRHLQVSGCHYAGETLSTGGNAYALEINIQTPHMPVTSDGKAPNLGPFKEMLDSAVRLAVARAKTAAGIVPEARDSGWKPTFKSSVLDHLDEAIAIVSGDGRYAFNLRNLYYQVRPLVMLEVGKLSYATFTNIITDRENDDAPIPGLYRNERGVLIHPHTGEAIPLGTLSVAKYERPAWNFNKVLYIEKEGQFRSMRDEKWPERHDCALMTSQGFASRAARDLIDALGDSDEPVEIFCVHDADAFGTKIYEALQEATRARPERRVQIVNLGLERAEAESMGLTCEDLEASKHVKPTAAYVSDEDHVWYQTHRYELNTMPPAKFIAWLDAKMAGRLGKVVPPADVVADRLRADLEERIRERETERILEEAGIDDIVAAALDGIEPLVARTIRTLPRTIKTALGRKQDDAWTDVVARAADELGALPSSGGLS